MTRWTWIAAALVLCGSVAGAAEPARAGAAATGADKDAKKPARRGAKGKDQGPQIDRAVRMRVHQAKTVFMFSVESCQQYPERCDKTLRDDAERRFLDTCGACATAEHCREERDAIRAGTAAGTKDSCQPAPGAK